MINKEKNNIPVAIFALFLTAFLWGLAFVFQSVGMKTIGPNTFNAMRFLVGGIFLIPVYFFMNHKKLTSNIKSNFICNLKGGLTLGLILFFAAMTQQISLLYTSVAKLGFITVLYIVLVPIIHIFFM